MIKLKDDKLSMLMRILIVLIFAIPTFAIDPSWKSVKTRVNHNIWQKGKSILVYKRRLVKDNFDFKKYQDITIKNKAKIIKYFGATNWKMAEKKSTKKTFFFQGTYFDHEGIKTHFIEGHYLKKGEVRHFLLTTDKKQPKLEKNIKEVERLLNEYL